MNIRLGHGYDIHPLKKGKKLYLGGVQIKSPSGLSSTTDGDVLLHAIIDAILGAMNAGDIGTHFPSSDPQYKGMRSTELLARVNGMMKTSGYVVHQIDAIIHAEKPKVGPHVPAMQKTIGDILDVNLKDISVKCKTNSGLGPIGLGKGMAASAVCLLGVAPWRKNA